MEEPGGRKETSVTTLGKSEEGKGGLGEVKSVEEPGDGKKETFVVASGSTAQMALRLPPLSLFLFDTSTDTLPRGIEELTSGGEIYTAALAKYAKDKDGSGAG